MEFSSRMVKAGEVIFRFGDSADCAYIVESGEISIINSKSDIIATVTKGELLGEMGIIDNTTRSATAVAKTHTILSIIDKEQFHSRLTNTDPVMQLLITVLLDRVRSLLHPNHVKSHETYENIGLDFIKLENELKMGLKKNQLQLFLQPIVSSANREVQGFEALVRWNHPERGLIHPELFIKLAEDSGIILNVGKWILKEAFLMSELLENTPNNANVMHKNCFMSINVSTPQFRDPNFIKLLKEVLQETGINPKRIKLEITESCLSDKDEAKHWIYKVKSLGVRVSLDDFGTGYSSLSYLHEFDLDTIKIDQSFIKQMLHDEKSLNVVESIISLANKLGLDIIAEGIETEAQFEKLRSLGCQYIQGFIISRPKSIESFLT